MIIKFGIFEMRDTEFKTNNFQSRKELESIVENLQKSLESVIKYDHVDILDDVLSHNDIDINEYLFYKTSFGEYKNNILQERLNIFIR
jgi:hypothetical protein